MMTNAKISNKCILIGIYSYDFFSEYFNTNNFFDSTVVFNPISKKLSTTFVRPPQAPLGTNNNKKISVR